MDTNALLIPIVTIVGGFAIVLFNMYQRGKARELRYRERMAMIERGMAPPTETPEHNWAGNVEDASDRLRRTRHGRAGIVIAAIGFGLAMIIGFAGNEPGPAIGVGGAVVLLGVAFIVNGFLFHDETTPRRPGDFVPPAPPSAPTTVPPDEQRPNLP